LGPLAGGLRGIGVPLPSGLQLAVSVDPKTAHIVHSEGQLPGPLRFATDYRDFRTVDGVLFAFSESNFASGQKTGETRLTKDRAPGERAGGGVPAVAVRPFACSLAGLT